MSHDGRLLITGGAGFIGYHLARAAKSAGYVVGIVDNLNSDLYRAGLKLQRLTNLKNDDIVHNRHVYYSDIRNSLHEEDEVDLRFENVLNSFDPTHVVHLAALAGVRDSFDNAAKYIDVNITGTANVIEAIEKFGGVRKALYASTSCVAAGQPLPWREDDPIRHQLNPYGYTKYINECQMKLSKVHSNAFRFFTVYGQYGRPDMAMWLWAKGLMLDSEWFQPVLYHNGNMTRDWTHVSDIISGILTILHADTPHGEVYNIGRDKPTNIKDAFMMLADKLHVDPTNKVKYKEKHPADTVDTWADVSKLRALGWEPKMSIEDGITDFALWFKENFESIQTY